MDMHSMVWGVYLEVLEQDGRRLSRYERQELAEHRRWLIETVDLIASTQEGAEAEWEQLVMFGDY